MTDLSHAFDPETGKYDYDILDRELDRAKSRLFLGKNAAFLGPILTSLEFQWDESIGTAATNGEYFKWSPKDFIECTFDERVSTVLHEVYHVARLHMARVGDRDFSRWNYACDIRINRDLIKDGYKIGTDWVQENPDCPHELEEDIYDWLKKNNIKPPKSQNKHAGDMKPMSAQAIQANINVVIRAIHQAQLAGKPGAIPGGLTEIISNFLTPVIPWEKEVRDWMTDLLDEDYTYARPNRRFSDIYLPTRYEDEGRLQHVICYQDVSGSVTSEDSLRFNSELKFLFEEFKPRKITIVQFDTKIQKVDVLEEGMPFTEIEIVGRGGTCLRDVRQHIIDNDPTAVIVFTDLCVAPMEPLPKPIPMLWAVNRKGVYAPFGKTIYIPSKG